MSFSKGVKFGYRYYKASMPFVVFLLFLILKRYSILICNRWSFKTTTSFEKVMHLIHVVVKSIRRLQRGKNLDLIEYLVITEVARKTVTRRIF